MRWMFFLLANLSMMETAGVMPARHARRQVVWRAWCLDRSEGTCQHVNDGVNSTKCMNTHEGTTASNRRMKRSKSRVQSSTHGKRESKLATMTWIEVHDHPNASKHRLHDPLRTPPSRCIRREAFIETLAPYCQDQYCTVCTYSIGCRKYHPELQHTGVVYGA